MGRKNTQIEKKCLCCNKSFFVIFSRANTKKYCSKECSQKSYTSWNKGLTKETSEKLRKIGEKITKTAKGRIGWSRGLTKETDKRIIGLSITKLNEKNPMWKGDNVKYNALHCWIRRKKIKSNFCENCGLNKPYDLANISNEYRRNINNFKWLCRSCHMKLDYSFGIRKPRGVKNVS